MIVVGLDLSLTCTGIAIVHEAGIETHRVKSSGKKGATVEQTALRISAMTQQVRGWVSGTLGNLGHYEIGLAVIESPSFGSTGGAAHERGGLWWGVAGDLADARVPIATVAPTTREVYAVGRAEGKGPERKRRAKLAIQARYGHLCEIPDDNVADAVALAAMGCRYLGHPIDGDLDALFTRAMGSAKWPASTA